MLPGASAFAFATPLANMSRDEAGGLAGTFRPLHATASCAVTPGLLLDELAPAACAALDACHGTSRVVGGATAPWVPTAAVAERRRADDGRVVAAVTFVRATGPLWHFPQR